METDSELIVNAIRHKMEQTNTMFFGNAWREKIVNILREESRYTKLVRWCDHEIETRQNIINVFSPADKSEVYTVEYFNHYQQQLGEMAMLIQLREMLVDNRCSAKERENIEYTICKVFKIKYNASMKDYI